MIKERKRSNIHLILTRWRVSISFMKKSTVQQTRGNTSVSKNKFHRWITCMIVLILFMYSSDFCFLQLSNFEYLLNMSTLSSESYHYFLHRGLLITRLKVLRTSQMIMNMFCFVVFTFFGFVTRPTRRVPLEVHEPLAIPERLSSTPVFLCPRDEK